MDSLPALTAFQFARLNCAKRGEYLQALLAHGAYGHYNHLVQVVQEGCGREWTVEQLEAHLLGWQRRCK